jgi:hypothetical protein
MSQNNPLLKHLVVLNIVSVAFYFWVYSLLGGVSEETMYFAHDAKYYFHYGDWIFGEAVETGHIATRPFLFPLFVKLCTIVGGIGFLWFCQFFMWLLSVNFIYLGIKAATKSKIAAWVGALIVLSNASFVALTLHGLTEVSTIFLLSIFVYLVGRNLKNLASRKFVASAILLLVLLSLIRPVFYPLLQITLITLLPYSIYKTQRSDRRKFIWVAVYLIPLFFQIGLMKAKYDTFSISQIGSNTFKNFFLAKGYADIHGMEYDEALSIVIDYSNDEVWEEIGEHKAAYLEQYTGNLDSNIKGDPEYLEAPVHSVPLFNYMAEVNQIYFRIHIVLGGILVILGFVQFFRRKWKVVQQLLIVMLPLLLIILSSGISFWQGDRLTLPSLPLWVALYTYFVYFIVKRFARKTI